MTDAAVQQLAASLVAKTRTQRQFEGFVQARMPGGAGPYDKSRLLDRIKRFLDFKIKDDLKNGRPDVLKMGPFGIRSEQYDSLLLMAHALMDISRHKIDSTLSRTDPEWLPIERAVWQYCYTRRAEHGLPAADQTQLNIEMLFADMQSEQMEKQKQSMSDTVEQLEPMIREMVYGETLPDFFL